MPKKISLIGRKFGKLKVITEAPRRIVAGVPRIYYLCQCDCGNQKEILSGGLSCNGVKSCGCGIAESVRERMTTHGHSIHGKSTRTYNIWVKINVRCYNQKHEQYKDYGGRGIKVCDRWRASFENFLKDMGECPPNLSIDRYPNNDGNYEPGNCRWATTGEQHRNMRTNRIVELYGFKGCFKDAAAHFNIPISTAASRLRYGWTYEQIFLTPVRH